MTGKWVSKSPPALIFQPKFWHKKHKAHLHLHSFGNFKFNYYQHYFTTLALLYPTAVTPDLFLSDN